MTGDEIGILIYFVIAMLAIRPIAGHLAWADMHDANMKRVQKKKEPDGGSWSIAYVFAVMACLAWPIIVCALIMSPFKVGAERRGHLERKMEKQTEELEEARRKLNEMEESLGLERSE
jgi:hypothetical protein